MSHSSGTPGSGDDKGGKKITRRVSFADAAQAARTRAGKAVKDGANTLARSAKDVAKTATTEPTAIIPTFPKTKTAGLSRDEVRERVESGAQNKESTIFFWVLVELMSNIDNFPFLFITNPTSKELEDDTKAPYILSETKQLTGTNPHTSKPELLFAEDSSNRRLLNKLAFTLFSYARRSPEFAEEGFDGSAISTITLNFLNKLLIGLPEPAEIAKLDEKEQTKWANFKKQWDSMDPESQRAWLAWREGILDNVYELTAVISAQLSKTFVKDDVVREVKKIIEQTPYKRYLVELAGAIVERQVKNIKDVLDADRPRSDSTGSRRSGRPSSSTSS